MRETLTSPAKTVSLLFHRHRLVVIIVLLSVLFSLPTSFAQSGRGATQKRSEILSSQEKRNAKISIPTEIVFVSTGPATGEPAELRFILGVEDIYYYIVIEEIKHGSTEGDPTLLSHSYFISNADIKRATDQQEIMNLVFRRWINSSEFELEINKTVYRVQYTASHKFKITPVK
jgi:hypothetical protein